MAQMRNIVVICVPVRMGRRNPQRFADTAKRFGLHLLPPPLPQAATPTFEELPIARLYDTDPAAAASARSATTCA